MPRNDVQASCRCGAKWYGVSRCHCSACHRTFSGVALFDRHRSSAGEHGTCLDPATLIVQRGARTGQPEMYLREGVWSGPEMDEATKRARFGRAS
jgi:hypothetical protein